MRLRDQEILLERNNVTYPDLLQAWGGYRVSQRLGGACYRWSVVVVTVVAQQGAPASGECACVWFCLAEMMTLIQFKHILLCPTINVQTSFGNLFSLELQKQWVTWSSRVLTSWLDQTSVLFDISWHSSSLFRLEWACPTNQYKKNFKISVLIYI